MFGYNQVGYKNTLDIVIIDDYIILFEFYNWNLYFDNLTFS